MSISIPGFQSIQVVCEDISTVTYRGTKESDGTSVLIKSLKAEYPTLEELARVRHEYKILHSLKIEGVIKPSELKNDRNGLLLILEDFGGNPWPKIFSQQTWEFSQIMQIAIQLSETLDCLHQNNIIHKNLKSQNIFINPTTGQVKIADFSIATRLSRENQTAGNPNAIEGTLAYMSPEQTGRMNRSIDYRTDFYSLGVTLYEMLTGELPFQSTDPLGLVYCHIAKIPFSPHERISEIPSAVSDIVMKLLAKTAEDRYQSACGIKADLEKCLKLWQSPDNKNSNAAKLQDFIPGKQDLFSQFIIPQKLYGRETEVASLMQAFDRVASPKNTQCDERESTARCGSETILVSGYSGIGKTSIVNEVHKPIVRQSGYFIAGKFDQFKRNIPYAAIIVAFQELLRHLLTESSENLEIWKSQLLEALGQNAQVIINVIPEVEWIVGKQPEIPQLGYAESQNRFNRVFQKFLRVFAKPDRPLVIFLDDLQWADSASLKLIQLLMSDSDSQSLLLIGAYRDNEVDATHPLMNALDEIRCQGARVNNIALLPLDVRHVSQLVADTLHDRTSRVQPLAELVFNKTQGNPFFITQLLQTLHQEKLLSFDFERGFWQWSLAEIQSIGITDYNVVELIARNIQKLPEKAQILLKLASCIGERFNLEVLSIINEKSQSETADDLWEGLQAGLVLPLTKSYKIPLVFEQNALVERFFEPEKVGYKFLHDRVQQAAYSLIPETEKKATHLKIGLLLLHHNTTADELEDNIFEIVNQLNVGIEFIREPAVRKELAKLNLMAGEKAKAAIAYEPAVRYLNIGLELLAENSWQSDYELTFNLHIEAAEAQYLNANLERAEILVEILLERAETLLDRVKGYELKMQFDFAKNRMNEAIETGLSVLEMLGFSVESIANNKVVELPFLSDLEKILEMTDPYQLAAGEILMAIASYAYSANPQMYAPLIFTMVNLCIERGHSLFSAYAYGQYGVILCGTPDGIEAGYRSGELALRLLEIFPAKEHCSKIYQLFNVFIRHFKEHIRETLIPLQDALQSALETGDLEYAGYAAFNSGVHSFLIGTRLDTLELKQANSIDVLKKIKQEFTLCTAKIWGQLILNLLGKSEKKERLIGEMLDESEMLSKWRESNHFVWLFNLYFAKMILCYLLKKADVAVENANLSAKHAEASGGWIVVPAHNFYYSLCLLAEYERVGISEREQYLSQIEANQKKMQQWAFHAPMNYQHKYDLVEAEKARVLGQTLRGMEYYDRAIAGAKAQGYIQEEAIANELAAEFYLAFGRDKVAKIYLTEAYYGYARWGATIKVRDLEERYPIVFSQMHDRTENIASLHNTTLTTGGISAALDLSAVLKASQAISGEIVLENLLDKLMNILIENAGARTGFLLLSRADQWMLVVEGEAEKDPCKVLPSIPLEACSDLPVAILNYVRRTQSTVVLSEATAEGIFTNDPYIINRQVKSVLCLPIVYQTKIKAILYLENNLTKGAFTQERLEVLNLLSSQAAISLENASLYQELHAYSQKLDSKNAELIGINESLQEEIARRVRIEEERLQLLKQLQIERGQLEAVLQQMLAGVAIAKAPSGKLILCNDRVALIWRRPPLAIDNLDLYREYPGFHPDGRLYSPSEWPLARSILTGEAIFAEEIGIRRGDGTLGTVLISSAPIRNEEGQIVAGVATFYDITENKEAEYKIRASLKEKEVLLKEIHHRVKNNLQIISSLLNLQSGYIKDKQVLEIFKDSENRVATMALIHEQLYQSKNLATIDLGEYIHNLVANLLSSYELSSQVVEELEIDIPNISLNIDAAVPCGLIINELVLNSLKHAFPVGRTGKISITLKEGESHYQLIISDNGIGFPKNINFQKTETLGLQLVSALIVQIEGSIILDTSNGTEFKIILPKLK